MVDAPKKSDLLSRDYNPIPLSSEGTETTNFKDKEEERHVMQSTPNSTGSFLNGSQIGLWKKFDDDGQLNGGVYQSGDEGTGLSSYVAYLKSFYKVDYQSGPFSLRSNIDGGFGAYSLIPDSDIKERTALGLMPSLRGFVGSEQKFFGLKFREGVEQSIAIPLGRKQTPLPNAPFSAGASVGRSIGSANYIFGVERQWYLTAEDVQDMSLAWNRDNSSVFFNVQLPTMSALASMNYYNNETRMKIQLSKLFPILGGLGNASLAADLAISGKWSSIEHGTYLLFGYSAATRTGNQGLFVQTALDIRQEPNEPSKGSYLRESEPYPGFFPLSGNEEWGLIKCEHTTSHGKPDFGCYMVDQQNLPVKSGVLNNCYINEDKTVSCNIKKFDKNWKSQGYNTIFDLKETDTAGIYKVSEAFLMAEKGSLLEVLQENKDLSGFIEAIKGMSRTKQLESLNLLAKLAYETYDSTGLDFMLGNEHINSIGRDDIYQAIRNYAFYPEKAKDTTVCRGIAKMIASVANDLEFEAHTVSLNIGRNLHVVTALREDGGAFNFINFGNGTQKTSSRKLQDALLAFARSNKYPPQLQFLVFDHNGKYERTLITNEGRLLLDSTTPPSVLDGFLRFED